MKHPGTSGSAGAVVAVVALLSLWGTTGSLRAAEAGEHDQHSHHHIAVSDAGVKRSVGNYLIPQVTLTRQDGAQVDFASELDGGKPVILAFIYTSCTTVCPMTSQVLSQTQEILGKNADKVRIVSVSIDPEYDTPARLREYRQKFAAKDGWQYYTGTSQASVAVQKAFQAFRGDKMDHAPLIFLNQGNGNSWVRLEGFPTAKQVMSEYLNLTQSVSGG